MKVLVLVLSVILTFTSCQKKEDGTTMTLAGTVESTDVRIASLVAGRILNLHAEEGTQVTKGAVLVTIDSRDYELQLKQAETVIKGAKARLKLVRNGARKEDIAAAGELVHQAEIGAEKFEREYQRLERLYQEKNITEKDLDDMKTQRDRSKSQLEQAKRTHEKALNGAQKEEIEAAVAALEQAEAARDILKKKIEDCTIVAPSDGLVLHKLAEPGEVASPGATLLVISDLSKVRIKAFVPEKELGFVKMGGSAAVISDSFPGKEFAGKISRVASEAEFTPKTIQTADERVKTVYEFKVELPNTEGVFKPGMPVDIVIHKG